MKLDKNNSANNSGIPKKGEVHKLMLSDWKSESRKRKQDTKAWIRKRGYWKAETKMDNLENTIRNKMFDDTDCQQITIRLNETVMSHGIIGGTACTPKPLQKINVKFEICR